MSKKGGYLIIDLENIDLLTQSDKFSVEKCKSLYELLESNYHKNVIISGITINGIEKNDCVTSIYHYNIGVNQEYVFKVYGIYIGVVHEPTTYSIDLNVYWLSSISGQTDESGVIKINFSDFIYKDNLCVAINHADGIINVKYNIIDGDTVTGSYIIYNDGTVKITLDSTKNDYYTLTVNGGIVSGLDYEIYYLG